MIIIGRASGQMHVLRVGKKDKIQKRESGSWKLTTRNLANSELVRQDAELHIYGIKVRRRGFFGTRWRVHESRANC